MKILYVGSNDYLAAGIMQRLKKEGNSLYLLSDSQVKESKKIKKCKYYSYRGELELSEIFHSIMPEVVIFAGEGYADARWGQKHKENMTLLMNCLDECRGKNISQFVFLSSVEVYGRIRGVADEEAPLSPHTDKGNILVQSEYMVQTYRKQYGLEATILRIGYICGQTISKSCIREWEKAEDEQIFPVCLRDFAEAIHRVIENQKPGIYNIVGRKSYSTGEFVRMLSGDKAVETEAAKAEENPARISTDKMKTVFEWIDFWTVEDLVREGKIAIADEGGEKLLAGGKDKRALKAVGRAFENLVLGAVFVLFYYFCEEHSLFSQIDWLLIYVVVISLFWGVKQSALSVVVASVAFLVIKKGTLFEMANFYLYVENLIQIVQYIFFGIVVGYMSDSLRMEINELKGENRSLRNRFEKLKEINGQTIEVKNEYEKRLLDSKGSLPSIYSIIQRIHVLESGRIFNEVLDVVRELLHTDTVAVYRYQENKKYIRLLTARNEESMVEGRSWDISGYPKIQYAIQHMEPYEGDVWKGEPAVILPVHASGDSRIVIVVKELPMEQLSLYTINMLRTLMLLIEGALERAMQYDDATRASRYVDDTDILVSEEFQKRIALEEEKKRDNNLLTYCLLEIHVDGDLYSTYAKVENLFRDVDVFGTDGKGRLFVLLINTSESDCDMVRKRLAEKDVTAVLAEKENIYG